METHNKKKFGGWRSMACLVILAVCANPSDAQTNAKAQILFQRARNKNQSVGSRQAALNDINQALVLEPQNATYWLEKAAIYTRMEEQEQALPCINKSLQYDKKNAAAWEAKGTILMGLSRYKEALEVMNEAVRLDSAPNIRMTHADVLMRINRVNEAETELDEMVRQEPNNPLVRQRRSRVAAVNNHWQKVVDDLTVVIASRNDTGLQLTTALTLRAKAYNKLKQYDRSIADLKRGLKLSPDDRPLHEELLNTYKLSGDKKSAQREKYNLDKLDSDFVP